jgi:hypothetical protein
MWDYHEFGYHQAANDGIVGKVDVHDVEGDGLGSKIALYAKGD